MDRHVSSPDLRAALAVERAGGKTIGFVPTMGYLHEGHLALVRRCVEENDVAVVSIFVNPAQFGPDMDLDRYPRDEEGDEAKLAELGVAHVYLPTAEAVYPQSYATWVEVEGLTDLLDGSSRPGYFRGICTVVTKLLNVVSPERAYFGQKDLQQALVIERLARDLEFGTDVCILPTVRAEDGLALSSRNNYLSPKDRALAPGLYRALAGARARYLEGERSAQVLLAQARESLAAVPALAIDYLEIVDLEGLSRVEEVDQPCCMAVAVDLNGTRLIDNVLLSSDGGEALGTLPGRS